MEKKTKKNNEEIKNKEEKVVKEEKKKTNVKKEGMTKERKEKIFTGVGIGLIIVLVLGLAYWVSLSYGENIDTSSFEFNYITIDDYLEYMQDSKARIIYVARPDCSFCQMEKPYIKRVAVKYNLTINYLDTTDFYERDESGKVKYDEEEHAIPTEAGKKFLASADVYKDGFGTPNTIIVKNGKIIDGIYSYVPESDLKTLFKNNGFIK